MKYIMYDDNTFVIIPPHVQHSVYNNSYVVSAGMINFYSTTVDGINYISCKCWGESIGLNIKSREEIDSEIINRNFAQW